MGYYFVLIIKRIKPCDLDDNYIYIFMSVVAGLVYTKQSHLVICIPLELVNRNLLFISAINFYLDEPEHRLRALGKHHFYRQN